jgi:hypothetical protein
VDEIIKRLVYNWAAPKLEIIEEFTEHMENNRLPDNDINNYQNWNHIKMAINEAEIKQGIKSKKNRIDVLYDDSEWLVVKPLSIEASINYGYGTKWCTSMKNSDSYFHKYSKNGVLVFVINRKNGVKYAFYSSPKEYSVWTVTDARIDSMETSIPFELLVKVKGWTNFDMVGPNYNYFDEEDKLQNREKKSRLSVVTGSGSLRSRANVELTEIVSNMSEMSVSEDTEMDVELDIEESDEDVLTMDEDMGDLRPQEEYDSEEPSVGFIGYHQSIDVENGVSEQLVDIEQREEQMVGHDHPTHGIVTEQGERTWGSPYPNGPGGGFEAPPLPDMENDYGNVVMEEMDEEMVDEDTQDYQI